MSGLWKQKLQGANKTKNPPENLAAILSTYPLRIGRRLSEAQVQSMLEDFVDLEYMLGMKGLLYDELKARFVDGAVDKAYQGEAWAPPAPPAFPKPPLHPPPPKVKNPNFSVRPITGGRTRKRKTQRRRRN
jgi:hypothetical protein